MKKILGIFKKKDKNSPAFEAYLPPGAEIFPIEDDIPMAEAIPVEEEPVIEEVSVIEEEVVTEEPVVAADSVTEEVPVTEEEPPTLRISIKETSSSGGEKTIDPAFKRAPMDL